MSSPQNPPSYRGSQLPIRDGYDRSCAIVMGIVSTRVWRWTATWQMKCGIWICATGITYVLIAKIVGVTAIISIRDRWVRRNTMPCGLSHGRACVVLCVRGVHAKTISAYMATFWLGVECLTLVACEVVHQLVWRLHVDNKRCGLDLFSFIKFNLIGFASEISKEQKFVNQFRISTLDLIC
jgi:hypothetical protein